MIHELEVPVGESGERLDVWLERRLEGCSRSLVARSIKAGRCRIQPGKAKPGFRLRGGECIVIEVPDLEPIEALPEDIPLRVLFEDDALIAIDKQPGMVVHPAIGHLRGTLINALLGRARAEGGGWQPHLVHRLDADTSGVIVVAKDPRTHQACQDAFRARSTRKRYLALVHGAPRADHFEHAGAIGRHPRDFRKRCVRRDGEGKEAYTLFVVRERHDDYCVVEARPRSGRTHQIRVHLADLNHPLLADAVYGRSVRWPLQPSASPAIVRQALHAWRLELPLESRTLDFEAPIPADLAPFVARGLRPLSE